MKHLLTILCILTSFSALAQFPNTHTQSSPYTKEVFNGSTNPKKGLINGRYSDTAAANRDYVAGEKGIQIVVGNTIYMRDSTATKWIVAGGYGVTASNITILNDSSISICNGNSCDTFKFTNIVVNNFTILNDSTLLVCDGNNACDTLHIPPTTIAKPYVDSVKLISGVLYYYINGNAYPSGNVSGMSDGLISGGQVIWSGTGYKFYVNPATYVISNIYYHSGLDSVTLAAPPTVNSRIDLIGVDITGHAFVDTGIVSATPIVPQAKLGVQIALTTGILLNAGDTIPNILVNVIYNENLGEPDEWSTHTENAPITADFNNTINPKKGLKDIFISRYNSQSIIYFATSTPYTLSSDAVVSGWIYLNKRLVNTIYAFLYNSNTGARTNAIPLSLDNFDSTSYQQFVLPTSNFTWTGNTNNQFNTLEFYFSGYDTTDLKGLRFDWITLQKGIQSVPPQIDYSNKLDSVTIKKVTIGIDTANIALNWIKGVSYPSKDTVWTGGNSSGSGTVINFSFTNTTGITGTVTNPTTTPNLSLAIDTSALPGVHTTNFNDTRYALISTLVGNYVKYSDTASMLSPYLHKVDTTSKWIPLGTKNPLNTVRPILALDSVTIGFDTIHLPELRYSLALRDTTKWTDSTLIDRKYLTDRINPIIAAVNTNTTSIASKADKVTTITINGNTQDLSTNRTWTISVGDSIISFSKNATRDSIVLVLKDGRRLAIRDSIGIPIWSLNGTAAYYKAGHVIIGDSTDDGHTLRVVGTMEFNVGSDAPGDIWYRDSLGTFTRLAAPTGFIKPVLGFKNGYPKWQEDSIGTSTTLSTLTDAGTVTWNYTTQGAEAQVTLGGNRTLSITNLPTTVTYFTLTVKQDATGGRTLALPALTKVINSGAGVVTLSTAANAIDILSFRWDGTTLFCTYGKSYN